MIVDLSLLVSWILEMNFLAMERLLVNMPYLLDSPEVLVVIHRGALATTLIKTVRFLLVLSHGLLLRIDG